MEKGKFNNKWNQIKYDASNKFGKACFDMQNWWRDNKEWAMVVIPAAVVVGSKVIAATSKGIHNYQLNKQAELNSCTVWDPNRQIHVVTKHPLTNTELQDYMRLTSQGMTNSEALSMMGLLR